MRLWLLLLFLPLAGCLGGPASLSPFVFDHITRGDPTPVPASGCFELLETLNERADVESRVRLHQSLEGGHYGRMVDDVMFFEGDMAMAESTAAPASGSAARAEVTGTNNQEQGADEADILKTDGQWTYMLHGGYLIITHSSDVGNISEVSRTKIGDSWGGQLLLDGATDRLVVLTYGGQPYVTSASAERFVAQSNGMTRIQVYDIANRAVPVSVEQIWVEGNNVGARLIDGVAYVVIHEWEPQLGLIQYADPWLKLEGDGLDWRDYDRMSETARRAYLQSAALEAVDHNDAIIANLTLRDHLPLVMVERGGSMVATAINDDTCRRFLTTPDDTGRSISTILALDIEALEFASTQIISGYPIVYGAPGAIVLASASQNDWWFWAQPKLDEATNLHWFDLDGLDVVHRASGRVNGIVQDQFGIDVHQDELRVATTTGTWGRWWLEDPEPMASHLVVFQEAGKMLVERGRVGPLAPDERLWSARFTDDRAYLVTFEQIDPLWVIDLSDPSNPAVLGELEIPGVSTYIHPLSDDALLTIGIAPGPDGLGLDWGSIQVSLFDISDPAKPELADVLRLSPGGKGWSFSAAVDEHKAFTYWDALGMLAVPLSTHHYGEVYNAETGKWDYESSNHIGLKLIDVDESAMALRLYGEVDQDHLLVDGQGYPYGGLDIQRSYFLGFPDAWPSQPVSVYAMSGLGLSAHDLESLEPQDSVAFGIENQRYCIDWC